MSIFINKFEYHVRKMSFMLADMAHFIHPTIVKHIQNINTEQFSFFEELFDGRIDVHHYLFSNSNCVFPGFRRYISTLKKGRKHKYDKSLQALVDDNWSPRHIWCFLAIGKCYSSPNWKKSKLNTFELAHLFPHKDDDRSLELVTKAFTKIDPNPKPFGNFTSATNVVLLPEGSVKPTDQSEQIMLLFFRRYIELYGEGNLRDMHGFKNEVVPSWYDDLKWNEPVLPNDWETKINELIKYRNKTIENKLRLQ